jgi:hypothetical protein
VAARHRRPLGDIPLRDGGFETLHLCTARLP